MLRFAKSIIDTVLGRKRPLDDDDDQVDQEQPVDAKKLKIDENMVYRVKVSNLPGHDVSAVKKFLKKLGYDRIKKAPKWDYCFITLQVEKKCTSISQ